MKILVATKRVQDYNVKVRPKSDGSDVDIDGIKMGINPFDENALEEALRIKEKIQSTEISVVSIGDEIRSGNPRDEKGGGNQRGGTRAGHAGMPARAI